MKDIRSYHAATRHHFEGHARGPGHLDWATQPDPFRRWTGCETVVLPLSEPDPPRPADDLFFPMNVRRAPAGLASLGRFWQLSLGLSAWKGHGGQFWPLRMNPSSGNLHPVEAHMIWPGGDDLDAGLYHYEPHDHLLERRRILESGDGFSRTSGFSVVLSTIHWRESWKYGERAWRYCQLDLGHAMAGLTHAARLLGWRCRRMMGQSAEELSRLAGYDDVAWPEHEREWPEALIWVETQGRVGTPFFKPEIVAELSRGEVCGEPGQLSEDHVDWRAVTEVAEAARPPRSDENRRTPPDRSPLPSPRNIPHEQNSLPHRSIIRYTPEAVLDAETVVRQRRSAQAFDPQGRMPCDVFLWLLGRTLPRGRRTPWVMDRSARQIDLVLFVHAVDEIEPGIYLLVRDDKRIEACRRAIDPDGEWQRIEDGFPLFRLRILDCRQEAMALSCRQEIAGDSCFSLGMLAPLGDEMLDVPHLLARRYQEAGMIGQVLYLAAEAWGFRGTGIGCFYDEPVRQFCHIIDETLHPVYHFTVGLPRIDARLETRAPYHHRSG